MDHLLVLLVAVTARRTGLAEPAGRGVPCERSWRSRWRCFPAALPDLGGVRSGDCGPVAYPSAWQDLRATVAGRERDGDGVSLPWAAFRRYDWNGSQVVPRPAPRQLTRTVVWNDRLPVTVEGRSSRSGETIRAPGSWARPSTSGRPLAPVLADTGIRWVGPDGSTAARTRRRPDRYTCGLGGPGPATERDPGPVRAVNAEDRVSSHRCPGARVSAPGGNPRLAGRSTRLEGSVLRKTPLDSRDTETVVIGSCRAGCGEPDKRTSSDPGGINRRLSMVVPGAIIAAVVARFSRSAPHSAS